MLLNNLPDSNLRECELPHVRAHGILLKTTTGFAVLAESARCGLDRRTRALDVWLSVETGINGFKRNR